MPAQTPGGALRGVRVLDLTATVAGQFCARLFADHGADVVLAEPPGGSRLRQASPVVEGSDGVVRSALFWHLSSGKRTVLRTAPGVPDLVATADVVVLDDEEELSAPRVSSQVVLSVSAFGRDNPYASWKGGEIVFQALSGTMHENGRPGEVPLYGVGHRASYAAGTYAYALGVAELLARAPGRHVVDVAVAEVAASMNFSRAAQYSYNKTVLGRDARETQRAVVRVGDGWLGLFVNDARWAVTCRALGVEDLVADPRFSGHEARRENWPLFGPILEERLSGRRVDELLAASQAARAVVARSMSLTELRWSPQLVERGFWAQADTGPLPRLGPMFCFGSTPQPTRSAAPDPAGADRTGAWLGREQPDDAVPTQTADATTPLAGVRVLDLTSAWAGPMASRLLAALGADVIKVEGPGRLDDWRGSPLGGDADRYPDLDPGERPYDRHFQYNTQNQDKRGIVLDLKDGRGRDLALQLAERADLVIANFSSGALDRLGLGWEVLHALNPRTILLEMPAYGSSGRMASWVAYGPSMELMAGIAGIIGYGDGRPTVTGPAYNDPIGALHGAAAAVTALVARAKTGAGQRVEVAQRDAAMHWIGEEIVAALATGRDPQPHGNDRDDVVPHGAYRTRGEDQWVAVAATTDEEFTALWRLVGGDAAAHAGLRTVEARRRRRAEIDEAVACWAARRDKIAAAEELQAVGVPAAPVLDARGLAESGYLVARGLLQEVRHREAGTHVYPILPVHVDGWTRRVQRPAPCFGEHNRDVLLDGLGLTQEHFAGLVQAAVVADVPTAVRLMCT